MGNYKFEPYVWVMFCYKGSTSIGRTIYDQDRKELVAFVTDLGKMNCIPFEEVEHPRKLSILSNDESENDLSVHYLNGFISGEA
ncbi:hypothetical protein [Bacteroides sedimenti]|uniref:Transposase n=1 Tax=Bacteroides sedimenti TaxID=2136147 RepID=A0ABN6Z266_9BACE